MMNKNIQKIELSAHAKINLSLAVVGKRPDGYHNIYSRMQDLGLHDVITIEKCLNNSTKYKTVHCDIFQVVVYLCLDTKDIPLGMDNLALKGVKALLGAIPKAKYEELETLVIKIDKRLPIAAGIAGGSGNAAVTMLGLNALLDFPLSLRELMDIGVSVGVDVPLSLMINSYRNYNSLEQMQGIEEASPAALVSGIGEIVEPVDPYHRYIILANPGIGVSTREAYEAIDASYSESRGEELFENDFEDYVLRSYPEAAELKEYMQKNLRAERVLMSGSGPTMVAYYSDKNTAEDDFSKIKKHSCCRENLRVWLTETGSLR